MVKWKLSLDQGTKIAMTRTLLIDEQWHKLKIILLKLGIHNKHNLRLTIEGISFRIRTGIPWEDLPL